MAIILPNQLLVLNAYAALVGETPGNTALTSHMSYIATNGEAAYKAALNTVFANTATATLAANIITNLGLTGVVTQAEAEAYLTANASNRVGAIIDLANILYNYSGDNAAATTAKTAYVNSITGSYNYSTNSANANGTTLSGTVTSGGQTFTLTTGQDNITGTSGNDTISSILVTGGVTSDTFSLGDKVDGGAGTDALNIATSDTAIDTGLVTVTNVETLNVTNGSAGLTAIDGDSDGYSTLTLDKSNAALTISGFGASTAITISAAGAALNTITYDSVTGTTDSATVTVGTATTGAGLSMLGIETVNVNLTGKAVLDTANAFTNATAINITNADTSTLDLSAATGATAAVTVTGAGVLTLGTLNASIKTVDASASTGGVTATLNAAQTSVKGGSGVDTITVAVPTTTLSVTTGAGNDVVDVSALVLTTAGTLDGTNEVINGGDGTDTLVTDEAGLTTAAVVANINKASSFETLRATSAVTAFAADGFTSINSFVFTADNTAGGAKTYTVESADSLTLTNSNSVAAITLNPVLDSGTDVVNLTLAASTANLTQFGITASQVETINLVSTDTDATAAHTNTITTLTVQNNTKINVSGAADLTFTTATGTELTIDGSAATGKLGITVVGGNDTITGGSAVDTINGAGGVDTISGNAGADVITGGTGADRLTGGDGADIFVSVAGDTPTDGSGVGIDVISDFNTGGSDILRLAAANNVADTQAAAPTATLTVQVTAGGKATFAAADDTLAEMITTLVADASIAANEVVFFELGSDTYVYGAGATADGTDDFMIKLTGVTGKTTLTESTTTAGDFTLA